MEVFNDLPKNSFITVIGQNTFWSEFTIVVRKEIESVRIGNSFEKFSLEDGDIMGQKNLAFLFLKVK